MTDRFTGFRVHKQGEFDSACALYCVLSATHHLFGDEYGAHEKAVREHIARSSAMSRTLFTSGVLSRNFSALAGSAGLTMYRPKNVRIDALAGMTTDSIWVAKLYMRFHTGSPTSGDGVVPRTRKCGYNHYVLVLDVSRDCITIADPHPRHEDKYELERRTFARGWRLARDKRGALWAPRLTRR